MEDGSETDLIPDGNDYGNFYYLGFNDLFDNWYVSDKGDATTLITRPISPKFRIGLQHGAEVGDPGDADFDSYRIAIEDGNGDLLGYQAQTVQAFCCLFWKCDHLQHGKQWHYSFGRR